ncbi:MAG: hypothetical protein IJP03_02580 [Christensenellaceae bacterium]|nr:hypothetical protein [Christensenellaceae bacterium]
MREELNHKKIAPLEGIFLILGMVVALGIVVFGIGFLAYLLKLQILTVASVVLLTVGATILMRKRLQNYSYTVARGMLVLQRCLGANEKPLASTRLSGICWKGDYADLPEEYKKLTREKVTFHREEDCKAVVYIHESGRKRLAIFSPTEKFWEELDMREKRIKEKLAQQQAEGESKVD